jgi:hypothetical protein
MSTLTLSSNNNCMCNTRLKIALGANAAFSALSGILFTLAAPAVAGVMLVGSVSLLGLGEVALLRLLGVGLLLFAAFVAWTAWHARPLAPMVMAISIADFGWVIGSMFLLAITASVFTASGIVAVAAVAGLVLVFGVLQLGALRKRH